MGGNLLKKWDMPPKRLSRVDYESTVKRFKNKYYEIINSKYASILWKAYGRLYDIPFYKDKESFGDCDLLINNAAVTDKDYFIKNVITSIADGGNYDVNTNVISFPFEGFQFDIIAIDVEKLDFAKCYFSFNDLGNLIGRMAHKMGLVFGHDGLKYKVREELFKHNVENSHVLSDITLTNDFSQALEFLDLNVSRYDEGFNSLEDIFEYVASSKYFNPDIYLLDNINHKSRIRDRKRSTYMKFLEWCKTKESNTKFQFGSKRSYLPLIFDTFPHLETKLANIGRDYFYNQELKSRINGNVVKEVLGDIDGKIISRIVRDIKKPTEKACNGLHALICRDIKAEIQRVYDRIKGEYS